MELVRGTVKVRECYIRSRFRMELFNISFISQDLSIQESQSCSDDRKSNIDSIKKTVDAFHLYISRLH